MKFTTSLGGTAGWSTSISSYDPSTAATTAAVLSTTTTKVNNFLEPLLLPLPWVF